MIEVGQPSYLHGGAPQQELTTHRVGHGPPGAAGIPAHRRAPGGAAVPVPSVPVPPAVPSGGSRAGLRTCTHSTRAPSLEQEPPQVGHIGSLCPSWCKLQSPCPACRHQAHASLGPVACLAAARACNRESMSRGLTAARRIRSAYGSQGPPPTTCVDPHKHAAEARAWS